MSKVDKIAAIALILLLTLTGLYWHAKVEQLDTEITDTSGTEYRYGELVNVKDGFYREYGCLILREYKKSVFCKLWTLQGNNIIDTFRVNVNLDKSMVEHIPDKQE